MNVIDWIIEAIENETIKEDQVVVVYDKNNNIEYLGKAQFAPLNLRQEFVRAETVGNELRINEREVENEEETEMKTSEMMIKKMEELKKRHDDLCDEMFREGKEENKAEVKKLWREIDEPETKDSERHLLPRDERKAEKTLQQQTARRIGSSRVDPDCKDRTTKRIRSNSSRRVQKITGG